MRENAELLLGEILKLHRGTPDLPKYLQMLLPQLKELDNDFKDQVYMLALQASNRLYQAGEPN